MDDLIAPLQDLFEGQIDFHGQRISEILCTVLLILSGAAGFIAGYIYEDIFLTLWITLAGTIITAFVVIPPWPLYNKNPEKWFAPTSSKFSSAGISVDGVKVA